MNLPGMNMRRVYLIARQDFLGYVKTWGFWISFILPFVFIALGVVLAEMDVNVEPLRYETILDETGEHRTGIEALARSERDEVVLRLINRLSDDIFIPEDDARAIGDRYRAEGEDGIRTYLTENNSALSRGLKIPAPKYVFVDPPANTLDGLLPFLRGERDIVFNSEAIQLNGVVHIHEKDGKIGVDHWSPNITNLNARDLVQRYFEVVSTEKYLDTGGLTLEGLRAAQSPNISIGSFDPTKEVTGETDSQEVTLSDRIPFIVALIMTIALWFTVFLGSYMLLTSVLEEKLGKLLEIMLASTRFSEIIFGKLLGVAALTITAMLPYIGLGAIAVVFSLVMGPPEITAGIA
ncbi:MAG: ABC transporter permease, partial [Hyphomonadaceae bacterium]|nr:ABC transporter permease [Hyphomonadaceae bacterium]